MNWKILLGTFLVLVLMAASWYGGYKVQREEEIYNKCRLSVFGNTTLGFFMADKNDACDLLKFSCENSQERYGMASCNWTEEDNDGMCKCYVR